MDETTTGRTAVVDERARLRAFTALGLALTSLMGGGVFASAFQWMTMRTFNETGSDQYYWIGAGVAPLVLGAVALGLTRTAMDSDDDLARPLARATLSLAVLAIAGAVILMLVTFGAP
jgi:hypothetical protein